MIHLTIDPVSLGREIALVLAHFLWQGAVTALIAWILLLWARGTRPATRYAIALSGFVALAAAPLATGAWIAVTAPTAAPAELSAISTELTGVASPASGQPSSLWHQLQPWCAAVWGIGVLLMTVRLALGWWMVFRLKRQAAPASDELLRMLSRLSAALGLRHTPRVGVSQRISEAMVAGIWRPVVLLPSAWLLELPPGVLEAVLAHELAHIRRWDPWINALQRVVETLLFYHPAVWWLSRRVRIEREFCCDEAAVRITGQPVVYAQTLELVARRHVDKRVPLFASGIGDPHMTLLQRVKHVLGRSGDDRPSGWLSPLAATLLIVAGIAVYRLAIAAPGPLYAQEGEREREAAERDRAAERERDERAEREGEERAVRDGEARREEVRRREARRERAEGEPGEETQNIIRHLEQQVAELRRALEMTQRGAEEARRTAEQNAREQFERAQHAAREAERHAREAADEERREGGPDRPRPPMLVRPDVPRDRPDAPREGEGGERRVRELRYEIRRGEGPPQIRMELEGPPGAEIREELNDIRNQVRELTEAVRNLQRTVESRGLGGMDPRGPEGEFGPGGPGGRFGERFPGFRGFRFEGERGPDGQRPEGERGPGAERREGADRRPEGDRLPGVPGQPPRERRPEGADRPDRERPAGDRVPGRNRPREPGRELGVERRPDYGDPPRGERAPEGERGADRARGEDAERRPDEDGRPDDKDRRGADDAREDSDVRPASADDKPIDEARAAFEVEVLLEKLNAVEALQQALDSTGEQPVEP